ncbi:hypothetical protein BDZ89DRAFT_254998 [Hymenopellis radicata]|nr:hypothetical protein BDZ89DRAFT_254998 [Hymenopellis radicata]
MSKALDIRHYLLYSVWPLTMCFNSRSSLGMQKLSRWTRHRIAICSGLFVVVAPVLWASSYRRLSIHFPPSMGLCPASWYTPTTRPLLETSWECTLNTFSTWTTFAPPSTFMRAGTRPPISLISL